MLFAALLLFTWYFAATLFLIFAGMLLGVALNAMTKMLGRVVRLPHALRLTIVCLVLAGLLSGVVFLGGTTIAQQATVLSNTIKSQLVNVKAFLEKNGIDTSYFDLGSLPTPRMSRAANAAPTPHNFQAPARMASSGGAIVSQTLKLLLGTVSAVGNFFIVLFLGLTFAAQPAVYRKGLLFMVPAQVSRARDRHRRPHRRNAGALADRADRHHGRGVPGDLDRPRDHRHPELIHPGHPGRTARLHSDHRRTDRRLDRGAGQPRVRVGRGASAFVLFLGVHALESYILTPILQRQALDIPPATLFAFQILLGVVFGIWGLALALPLMAIVKVMIDISRRMKRRPIG